MRGQAVRLRFVDQQIERVEPAQHAFIGAVEVRLALAVLVELLNALAGAIYLSWLGRQGIVELGTLMAQRTAYARERVGPVEGVELLHGQPVVREFPVRLAASVDAVLRRCAERDVTPGYPLGRDYPEHEDGLLVAITERRTRADIDRLAGLVRALEGVAA